MSQEAKKSKKTTQLDLLKEMTVVVADTGDFNLIPKYKPVDTTTNPSLIYKATQMKEYAHFLDKAVAYAKEKATDEQERLQLAVDYLFVSIGIEILKLVPGRVSTEVDARLSYDKQATIDRVMKLKKLYEDQGVDTGARVLFKIASTWEGIQAARELESRGVHCNLTLLFSFAQAVACADAKVTLISPFVGRILDYWKKETGKTYAPADDPGVQSVSRIYNYYKCHGVKTIVMGASFRSPEQALELAGCDYLTLGPSIMDSLLSSTADVPRKLSPKNVTKVPLVKLDEAAFRWEHNQDPCAVIKTAEGIRAFSADIEKLEEYVKENLKK